MLSERSFSALRRIKTFLRSTTGQDRISSIAVINIERKYATKTKQDDMQMIIDIFGHQSNRSSYLFKAVAGGGAEGAVAPPPPPKKNIYWEKIYFSEVLSRKPEIF